MKILYIFPHPDDESFGPAPAMSKQRRHGYQVYLLTLTRGGATKQRFKYGYSVKEMGKIRYQEMQNVSRILDLSGLTILDFPDNKLKEIDSKMLETAIINHTEKIRPQVIVTYPVHGISGFPDHLIAHNVVKRVFVEISERALYLKRLAFFTISEDEANKSTYFPLSGSKSREIDCVIKVDPIDIKNAKHALDCYVTFKETVEKTGIKKSLQRHILFEIFNENHDPPLTDLFDGLG
jgi:LmbE family N-acetylglucosaminyl deacetylase